MAELDHISQMPPISSRQALPQNIDAERSVLAAMILSPDILEELLTTLGDPEMFYRPAHRKIFTAIVELYSKGIPVDQLSLAERLRAKGELEEVGGRPYIIELANYSFALANWATHVEMVKRTALLRDLISASSQIQALAYDAPDDTDEVVEDAEKCIMSVTDRQISNGFRSISDLMRESFDQISELDRNKDHVAGVSTGFTDLDNLLAGLRPGTLIVIAARPSVGKSAFALNLGINAASKGASVALFSLEMSAAEIMPRILSSEAGVPLQKMRNGSLTVADWGDITAAGDRLQHLDFWIDDTPSISIVEMKAKARRQLHGKEGKGLIIIDYLQLMQPQGKRSENRQVEIADISRGLKILAKEMQVPVIALSQLSRAVEARKGGRPMLSDLRESGAIEQDADVVMFLDRPKLGEDPSQIDVEDRTKATLIVAKNRNGAIQDIPLAFIPEFTKFGSIEYRDL